MCVYSVCICGTEVRQAHVMCVCLAQRCAKLMIAALTRHTEVRGWTWGGGNTGNAREARGNARWAGGAHTAHGHTAHQALEAQSARARQTNEGIYQVIAVATGALARRCAGALMIKMFVCMLLFLHAFYVWPNACFDTRMC